MLECSTSRLPPEWEMALHLAVDGDVFDGVYFVLSFFPRDSWMICGTELSQFLRIFLPTLTATVCAVYTISFE